MLQLTNVRKAYQGKVILNIPSLLLDPGIYWIQGANGSGKSTLLKIIAGMVPFEGEITFKDSSLRHSPLIYRQHIGWAAAEPLFPPFMTGMDLVILYQRIRKVPQPEIDRLIERFNVGNFIQGQASAYSAGMTKRLSLLLAFIGNPALIILDEPLTTLDTNSFTLISDLILEFNQKAGTSFLMSSHQDLDTSLLNAQRALTVINQSIIQ
ncbi:MAG: transporter, ATP-binding protein [Bacteroidetes bacterium]|uniref:ABC transporter ATP-binding protein n=1 Tax=Chitinophaga sp. LS1 TaxID=3051176 RepID=UPI001D3E8C3B|nr:ABC transporter ATP-binding protein [Chitinophaga sp. LS1]MBP1652375.1 transporter, ATP-binding protein [Bacteroidota bacterium]WPV65256.1 ABC transporter ATP-binding protein [Chitinophaga sp. LS1]